MRNEGFSLVELLVVIGIVILLAAILFPVFPLIREQVHQTVCMNNQRQLAENIQLMAQDSGERLPTSEQFLTDQQLPAKLLRCPSARSLAIGYLYNQRLAGTSLARISNPSTTFLTVDGRANLPERRHQHCFVVSYVDGHVALRKTLDFRIIFTGVLHVVDKCAGRVSGHSLNNIYSIYSDGGNLTQLTKLDNVSNPVVSPDGTHVACTVLDAVADGKINSEIALLDISNSKLARLTDNSGLNETAVFSRDGIHLAFSSNRDGATEIYLMNNDGSGVQRLTYSSAGVGNYPIDYTSDGKQILFESSSAGREMKSICLMDATNGSHIVHVANISSRAGWARMSPDGKRIVFSSETTKDLRPEKRAIFLMNVDGSQRRQLTSDANYDDTPVFTPDGSQIIYSSIRPSKKYPTLELRELFIMDLDGSNQQPLSSTDLLNANENPLSALFPAVSL